MDERSIDHFISTMLDAPYIAVDTETTGIDGIRDGRDYLMGIPVAYRLGDICTLSAYFPFRHQTDNLDRSVIEKLRTVFDRVPLVFHNAKFDLHSLATLGVYPKARIYDTMIIAHMLNEELPSKELDWLAKTLLNDSKEMSGALAFWTKTYGWASVPPNLMEPYAKHDAELTLQLFELLWPKLREQELATLWPFEDDFIRLLRKMEHRGIRVNRDFCQEQSAIGRSRMGVIAEELGFEVSRTSDLSDYLLNQLGLPVLKISDKTGKPCFDKKVMEEYDKELELKYKNNPAAKLILEYRGWMKVVTSFYEPCLNLVSPDGRIRANYKVHGTKTTRLSCEDPNLQQIPRDGKKVWNGQAKRAFVPEEGYELWEFDYKQLEYRLACAYSGEPELIRTFNEGIVDIFTKGATDVFGDGDSDFRNTFKTYSYARLYGAGVEKIALTLGISVARAEEIKEAIEAQYPNLTKASRAATRRATERGYIRYWTGRRRHFANRDFAYKAWNSLLQGGGAELVKRAMLRVNEEVDNDDARILLQVHDSIVMEIRKDQVDDIREHVSKLMTDFPDFGVRLEVDSHLWGSKA